MEPTERRTNGYEDAGYWAKEIMRAIDERWPEK
jgi:hypothetical protein